MPNQNNNLEVKEEKQDNLLLNDFLNSKKPEIYDDFLSADLSDDSDTEFEKNYNIKSLVKKTYKANTRETEKVKNQNQQFIPIFRGTKFLPPFFSNEDRRRSALLTDQSQRDLYSNMSFRNSNLKKSDMGKYISGQMDKKDITKLQKNSRDIIKFFNMLNNIENVNVKINSKYLYEIYYFLLQINTNIYDKFNESLKGLSVFLVQNKTKYGLSDQNITLIKNIFKDVFERKNRVNNLPVQDLPDRKPIISTGADPYNGAMYALPIFEEETFNLDGFNPEYDNQGKPKHRFAGMVHIMLLPKELYEREIAKEGKRNNDNKVEYIEEKNKQLPLFSDIQLLHKRNLLNIKTRIANSSQSELAFIGKIEKKYIKSHVPVYFPNFAPGKEFIAGYHDVVFGIESASKFKYFQDSFTKDDANINQITQEITKILNKHIGDICYNMADHISTEKLTMPQITDDGEIKFGRSARSVTMHARLVNNDKATAKPTSKSIENKDITNIGFNSGDISFSNRSKKAGYVKA